jgi:hypothetical protein
MSVFQPRRREDLQRRLAAMKLDLRCFERALARGAAEAASYSAGAPKSAPELGRWMRTVEALHDEIMDLQRDWERSDQMNLDTWINPSVQTAIVVSSGDENCGELTGTEPSNRNPKGLSFGVLVAGNEQMRFFDTLSKSGKMVNINETWVFLYHARNGFVYSELSVPIVLSGSFIESWHQRIIFPRFDDGTNTFEPVIDEPEPGQDFGFTIQRR